MSGLSTDITPPDVANFNPFAADSNKTFALTGDSLPIPSGEAYTFEVDPWCQSLPCDATSN